MTEELFNALRAGVRPALEEDVGLSAALEFAIDTLPEGALSLEVNRLFHDYGLEAFNMMLAEVFP